jgi:hypothetical protein
MRNWMINAQFQCVISVSNTGSTMRRPLTVRLTRV